MRELGGDPRSAVGLRADRKTIARASEPVAINGPAAALWYLRFARSPLRAIAKSAASNGPFVKLPYPSVRATKPRRSLLVAVGSSFNRDILGDPATWTPINIGPPGRKGTAIRRLSRGILGMSGRQHEHYRRLLIQPLRRQNIDAMGADMVRLADEQLESWPLETPIDLGAYAKRMARTLAIGLLFGDDREHGYPIAELINEGATTHWSWKILAFPVDAPGTPYRRLARGADHLERRVIEWADRKRGDVDPGDLLSIVVNSPDESGCPASTESIVGHTPTMFGAAYETCQNGLLWTLLLLEQHPRAAHDLYEDLKRRGAGDLPTYDQIMQSPVLDSIINESLRILPPVPQQIRVAQRDTSLNGYPVPARTKVLLSPFLTNRDRELYPNADRFLPSRWETISPSPYEFAVFSAGPRGCPGYAFALATLKVAVATIMIRRRIVVRPGARIDYKVHVALTSSSGVPAALRRQDGAFAASPIGGNIGDLFRPPA